jgi:hypothetical protein
MKHIFTFLILIISVAFTQDNKKVSVAKENEFPPPPPDEFKAKKVSEWGEKVFDKPPIVEKEWHEPTSFDPDKYLAEEDTILAKLNKKPNPFLSDEEVWLPAETVRTWAEAEMPHKFTALRELYDEFNPKYNLARDYSEFEKTMKEPSARKNFYNTFNSELNLASTFEEFERVLGFTQKSRKSTTENDKTNNPTFLQKSKRFALPIITIIALVFLCYRLIRNITVAKIKTVLKSDAANKIYKIVGLTVFVSAIVLWYTNPTLREFKEITPSKLAIEKDNGFCEEEWKLSHTKVKNCIFYSYYKFSFGCSDYNRSSEKVELIEYKEFYYIGIFNNFYRVEYP